MISIIYFLIALGVIVVVHEFGHLIVAKRNGVFCHEFSIGMGPKLVSLGVDKTGTKYSIRAIPLGGYVMLAGEDNDASQDEHIASDKLLNNKSTWVRFKVLVAGSTMNFILAIVLMMFIGFFFGISNPDVNEVMVIDSMPASMAGIETGAEIISVDGVAVSDFNEIKEELVLTSEDKVIEYQNPNQEVMTTVVTPNEDNAIGITPNVEKYNFFKSILYGFTATFNLFLAIIVQLKMLFGPEAGVSDLSGPIGIFQMSSSILSTGIRNAFLWIAYLSVNIGFMNLLPIPALDGGRLVFVIYEMIFRKPANKKVEEYTLYAGVFILLALFIFVSFNDILRIFS